MRNRIKTMILVCMTILLAASAAGCNFLNAEPQAAEDEIMLKIQLDLKEDIGLLIIRESNTIIAERNRIAIQVSGIFRQENASPIFFIKTGVNTGFNDNIVQDKTALGIFDHPGKRAYRSQGHK